MNSLNFKLSFLSLLTSMLLGAHISSAQIIISIPGTLQGEDKTWVINDLLDSLVNNTHFTGGVVTVNENAINVDTVFIGKVKKVETDSVVIGKFLKKHQKKISSAEFWGVITVDGKYQRFYQTSTYQVWETPSPYIYRVEKDANANYYFSENLLSPIYSLDRPTIQNAALDTTSKRILNNFMDDRSRANEYRTTEHKQTAINISLNIVSIVLQVMLSGGGSYNHSPSSHHTPASTGPRR